MEEEQNIIIDLLRIPAYVEKVGNYSAAAIRTKISKGVWRNGHEYIKAPGTGVLISISGVEKWARQKVSTLLPERKETKSKSISDSKVRFTSRL